MSKASIFVSVMCQLFLFLQTSHAMSLNIPATGTKCVSEEIQKNVRVIGVFLVFRSTHSSLTPGLSVTVTSPYGNNLYHQENLTHGHFAFTTSEEGSYTTCFWVTDGKDTNAGDISVHIDWKIKIAAKDWNSDARKEKLEISSIMDSEALVIVMICLMIQIGVFILAFRYANEEADIEDRIRRLRRRRRRQQQPTSFMIVAFVNTAQECVQALADGMNFTTSYEIFKEYCFSEMFVERGQPRVRLNDCIICHERFQATDACLILSECEHVFHEQCVTPWLRIRPKCPSCRSHIPLFTFE